MSKEEALMNQEKGSDINMPIKIPEHLQTDTEKIVWLGENIRTHLLTIEKVDEIKAKAREGMKLYEITIREVLKRGKGKDGQT